MADAWGRRISFLLSVIILLATTLVYLAVAASGAGLLTFCAVSVLMGLGFTFYSGAVEAWVVDALIATGFEGQELLSNVVYSKLALGGFPAVDCAFINTVDELHAGNHISELPEST